MSIPTRKRWHEILNRLPSEGACRVIEIGVWRGTLSRELLKRPRLQLVMVDAWNSATARDTWIESGSKMADYPQAVYDEAFIRVQRMAYDYRGRARVVRCPSPEAKWLVRGTADIVFIDGDHSYEAVKEDIAAWLNRVRPGGYIGGHDWGERFPGVRQAVRGAFDVADIELGDDKTWFVKLP